MSIGVDKIKNEGNDWFVKVHSQGESNIARKTLAIDIFQVRKKGRHKLSWAGQMRRRQQRFGLTQQEQNEIANARPVTRSMGIHPRLKNKL